MRSWRYVPGTLWYALRSLRQAKAASGNLRVALLAQPSRAFWTCTVWQDEASMRAFTVYAAHRKAMGHLPDWCDEAAVAHWEQDRPEPPSWAEVHRRIQSEGRRSKVKHPSAAQQRFDIPVTGV